MPEKLDTLGGHAYDEYRNDLTYRRVSGLLTLPTADGPPVTSQVHEPYNVVRQTFGGTKRGSPPLLPSWDSDEKVLAYTVSFQLPTPMQSAGGSGFRYTAAGYKDTLEGDISTPSSGYATPRWPFRMEPMETLAENNGYRPNTNELIGGQLLGNPLEDPSYLFPQAYVQPSAFFSADI